MKIYLSFLLLSFGALADCSFKDEVKKVVSLSAPVSVLLNELGLLSYPKVIGISHYHPIGSKKYQGKRYPGGIFLAPTTLDEFSASVVFFDESRELKKILGTKSDLLIVELKTRNLLPLEALEHSISVVNPFLKGCEKETTGLRRNAQELQEDLIKKIPAGTRAYFYLGKINPPRFPELMMVQDGVVKLLQKEKKITTYPSSLSYVNWSSKILRESSKETIHVGLIDSGDQEKIELTRKESFLNLTYPGALVPGITQLRAFHFWASSL